MKIRLPRKRRYRVFLYVVSIILVLLAIDLTWVRIGRRITIGVDTTHITRPVDAEGYVDYYRAAMDRWSAGVTRENNAVGPLLEATGVPEWMRPEAATNMYVLTGTKPPAPGEKVFMTYAAYLRAQASPSTSTQASTTTAADVSARADKELLAARTHTWAARDNPLLAAYLMQNERAIALYQKAAARARYFCMVKGSQSEGGNLLIGILLPSLGNIRDLGNIVLANAMLRAGTGDTTDALTDILAVHRLARLLCHGPTIIEHLVGIAIERNACETEQSLASQELLSEAQARRFLGQLDELSPMAPVVEGLEFERLSTLDALQFVARRDPARRFEMLRNPQDTSASSRMMTDLGFALIPSNFNATMREANRYFDAEANAARAATFGQRQALMKAATREFERETQSREVVLNPSRAVLTLLLPYFAGAQAQYDAQLMCRDLSRLSLALAIYRGEHQTYPASLAELAPKYIDKVPEDLFVDRPLHYQPLRAAETGRETGGYLLYSVGPNQKDDGGHNFRRGNSLGTAADDLAVRVPEFAVVDSASSTTTAASRP